MKLHDSLVGAVLIVFGLWVVVTARGFPQLTGQMIGPGTFPTTLGVLCALGGVALVVQGLRHAPMPLVTLEAGWRRPDRLVAALVAVGGAAFLAATFETVGFPLGGSLLLAAIFFAAGLRHPGWTALSVAFVLSVYLLLTRLLYVPLPAGVLDGIL